MKSKKSFLILIFILISILFTGCQSKNIVSPPDKIIIHYQGNQKQIDKNNKDFNKIVSLTNQRFPNKLYEATDVINDETMNYIYDEGIGIEFVYSKEQTLSISDVTVKYYRLYFQLTSKTSKDTSSNSVVNTFQSGDKNGFSGFSRGHLAYSQELVNLIESIK